MAQKRVSSPLAAPQREQVAIDEVYDARVDLLGVAYRTSTSRYAP
jgi:hypothetical protein